MIRIQPINADKASAEQKPIFTGVKQALGFVPNLVATMAHSPAVANAYLAFHGALAKGVLSAQLREMIALTVAQANQCDYCLAVHTALGGQAGLSAEEMQSARRATSGSAKTGAALAFAVKVVEERGHVSDEDVAALRQADWNDAEIAEIVAHVALNIFTNYFNHVAGTVVDFPAAPKLETCACQ